ncbi:helix-turn-helix domain-containing protein [Siansivirga zeaxanthinifaciens]|uniref:DNA-binding protein n=1 Tax=Siansivirga zeaxanthinifaciens CC-SAMT-1 TaxID=1454006 RepID=A0A0C5WB13_9FLAO|nr:helix-turn-helix transcriptional regulator [Siansivirga zeaxanthinifaciens]AJR04288.1 DNA-binding protein [Siansivirga zeaxanthinifaciens CC-SAMT-1]
MINTDEFTIRLQKVIDYYGENASSFAEKIGVQRSSISHVLSGRNKPSLEFILKILSTYPDVELYWLLNGKGSFPSDEISNKETKVIENKISETTASNPDIENKPLEMILESKNENQGSKNKTIERIVIFYSDGTFKNYSN